MIHFMILALTNLMCITACNSITESINTQATDISVIETGNNIETNENEKIYTNSNLETNNESSSQLIEINNQLESELINVIDCYYHLKDLIGGRYYYITEYYEIRNLSDEYSPNDFNYNTEVKYCEFNTLDDFYSIYDDFFFRNNKTVIFSSEITRNDYEEIVLSYLTSEFYQKNFYGIFDDIIDDDNYISPSKYWYCNEKLLINSNTDYIYGGANDYNYFVVNESTNDSIIVTIIRKYTDGDSHVQFSFVLENDLWKISDVNYLD